MSTFTFTITATFTADNRDDAFDDFTAWLTSPSNVEGCVTITEAQSMGDPIDPVERALQGLRDYTAELLGTPTNERNPQ